MTGELILTNARVVTPAAVVVGTVSMTGGMIEAVEEGRSHAPGALDLEGDFLLPGLVELHTDNLERHLEPRPGVRWPSALGALLAHDSQIAAAGITTVLDAVCVGDYREGGERRRILAESIRSIAQASESGTLRADHHLHLRCEVADDGVVEMFDSFAGEALLRLVSVMDHTPGHRQWRDLSVYREFHRDKKWSDEEFAQVIARRETLMERNSGKHRQAIVARCKERGIPLASHDDTTEAHVEEAAAFGIAISEFPTTLSAAALARRHGMSVIMGAPNLVRGGSHSGNVSAATLAEAGLLDMMSSDYVPSSLLHAAFLLHERLGIALPSAIATVSANPAAAVGLSDRGGIEPGKRGDLVRVTLHDDFPVVRSVWRAGDRVS
ncbi:alpha-D-ribose 1-methylphosphonate 5-triphosphate diphosphatase [Rhodospirillaceae bacterium SYSU D60014]|uniref:alpha-D-ribose 1-methylphosphonate 5-triphosphate diphosphatase n=1 Tax=Virgifigura deserti TaxID=2268457 RepID=UPI000E6741F0